MSTLGNEQNLSITGAAVSSDRKQYLAAVAVLLLLYTFEGTFSVSAVVPLVFSFLQPPLNTFATPHQSSVHILLT